MTKTSFLNIAIAGCGPAGLAAALLLHRQGHRVTLYDQFAKPQPIGSGLMIQPTGLAVLNALGLADRAIGDSARIDCLKGRTATGRTALDARYADLGLTGRFGLGIHRGSLFSLLFEAASDAGIAIETGCQVADSRISGNKRSLIFADGRGDAEHDLLIDALGLQSPLTPAHSGWLPYGALWSTLEWKDNGPFDPHLLEQRYRGARQMLGILPTGKRQPDGPFELSFFWSLRADAMDDWRASGLDSWKAHCRALWPETEVLLDQFGDAGQLTFARYAHRTLANPVGERLIHIGDAWHSASPQLGQGANMALLDAFALSRALTGEGPLQDQLGTAVALRRSHVRLYQALSWLFTPLYQSDSVIPAKLRDLLLVPAGRIPPGPRFQAALVSGLVGGPLAKLALDPYDYNASSTSDRASAEVHSRSP